MNLWIKLRQPHEARKLILLSRGKARSGDVVSDAFLLPLRPMPRVARPLLLRIKLKRHPTTWTQSRARRTPASWIFHSAVIESTTSLAFRSQDTASLLVFRLVTAWTCFSYGSSCWANLGHNRFVSRMHYDMSRLQTLPYLL